MKGTERLSSYIESITGGPPRILPLADHEVASLPLFLRTLYGIHRITLFGQSFLIAVQEDQLEQSTPSEYAKHAGKIAQILGVETALVLPQLPPYSRNRLVQQGVPFIVPGRQMFLPMLLIDLRERFPRGFRGSAAALSAPSQVLVIY